MPETTPSLRPRARRRRLRLGTAAALLACSLPGIGAASATGTRPIVHLAAAGGEARLVADAPDPSGRGYWGLLSDGRVLTAGAAPYLGAPTALRSPAVGIAGVRTGRGYWVVTADGAVYSFGRARDHGGLLHAGLTRHVTAIAATPDGRGYWLVDAAGRVFAFGDARRLAPPAPLRVAHRVVAITPTADGLGYWLVTSTGRVLPFGDARFFGSSAGAGTVGLAPEPNGTGYWLAGSDGVTPFGAARSFASTASPGIVAITATATGYWVLTGTGRAVSFGTGHMPSLVLPSTVKLPPSVEPAKSIAPPAALVSACFAGGTTAACNAASLSAIDQARSSEGYGPLALPKGFAGLSIPGQLLAVANAERTSRGLPSFANNVALDLLAQVGALAGTDPSGPSGYAWGSNVAWGYPTPLAADYGWMYDDGPDSPNVDCTAGSASGCWGHRRNILAAYGGAGGAGAVDTSKGWVLTQLFVGNY